MLIYDVGMTGEWLGEVEALAELAGYLNLTEDVALLKKDKQAWHLKSKTRWCSFADLPELSGRHADV